MSDINANLISPVDYRLCEQEAVYALLDVRVLDALKQAIIRAETTSQANRDEKLVRKAVAAS